ncbi:MAG: hypothetical protein KJ063_24785, partial [Anaerolineae bacterium]|nr:hypothetical protein [Anaerolineae bacterium]
QRGWALICVVCGAGFVARRPYARYCPHCQRAEHHGHSHDPTVCAMCPTPLPLSIKQRAGRYCSPRCKQRAKTRRQRRRKQSVPPLEKV